MYGSLACLLSWLGLLVNFATFDVGAILPWFWLVAVDLRRSASSVLVYLVSHTTLHGPCNYQVA